LLFFPFLALQFRFDFDGLRHELVTQGIEDLGYFLFEAGDFGMTKTFLRLLQKALGVARVKTIPRRVARDISQQCSTQLNDKVAKTLIFGLQGLK